MIQPSEESSWSVGLEVINGKFLEWIILTTFSVSAESDEAVD